MLNPQILGVLMVHHTSELVIIAIPCFIGLILLGLLVRKMKELVIQKNEFKSLNESFLDIVNSTKDSFVLFDSNGRFSHANNGGNWFLYDVLKADKSTFNLESLVNQLNDITGINVSEQISKGDFFELPNVEIEMDTGEILNFYCRINPVVSKGKKQYTYLLARNITDEILKHRIADENGFLISEVMNYSRDGFISIRKDYTIQSINAVAISVFNLNNQSILGESILTLIPIAENSDLITKCEYVLMQQEPLEFDYFFASRASWFNVKLLPNKFGLSFFFFENTTMKVNTALNDAERLALEDITDPINYEQRLLQGREFLMKITDSVPIVLFQCEIDDTGQFNFMFLSKEIERFGVDLTAERIYKRPELIFRLIHPDDLPRVINTIEISQKTQIPWNVEFRLERNDNQTLWMKGIGVPELQTNGRSVWFGYFENISDKKERIKEIEAINTRFVYASKAVNEAIWEWDIEKNTLYWSDGLSSIFGYLRSNYPTLDNLYEYIHPADYQEYAIQVQRNLDNKELELFSMEYRFKKPDGYFANIVDKGYIIRDYQGKAERVIGSIRDVSEVRLFEKKKKELINETQEFERNQFSMELHDGLAQQLVALNLYISHLEEDIPADKRERIEICKKIVLDSLNQTRYLCYNLSPPELSNGLISGLKALFDRLNALNGMDFKFDFDNSLTNDLFESIDIYNVYRIIQEFVNNSLKHSEGTEVSCEICHRPNQKSIAVQIRDNGKGFDTSNINYGFGIQNIKKRANLAGAKIQMSSGLGEGCSLRMNLHYV
jgi:PAS domain S-box-containing protein